MHVAIGINCCAPASLQGLSQITKMFFSICILVVFAYKSTFLSIIHPPFMCAQVLRSAVHNYPSCANMIWEKLRDNVLNLLQIQSFEDQKYDANFGPSGPKEESSIKERCLVAGINVMFSVILLNNLYFCAISHFVSAVHF